MEKTSGSQRKLASKESIQLLTTISLISICLFIVLILVLHFLRADYNPLRTPTSAYAVGPYGFLMSIAFLSMSVSSLALVTGLYKGISKSARPKPGLILLGIWGVGVLIAMSFPIAPEGTPSTYTNTIHRINGTIIFLSLTVGSILLSASFRRDNNWRSLYRTALTLSIIMLFGFIITGVNIATESGFEGLCQRFFLIVFTTWFIMVTLHLRRIG